MPRPSLSPHILIFCVADAREAECWDFTFDSIALSDSNQRFVRARVCCIHSSL